MRFQSYRTFVRALARAVVYRLSGAGLRYAAASSSLKSTSSSGSRLNNPGSYFFMRFIAPKASTLAFTASILLLQAASCASRSFTISWRKYSSGHSAASFGTNLTPLSESMVYRQHAKIPMIYELGNAPAHDLNFASARSIRGSDFFLSNSLYSITYCPSLMKPCPAKRQMMK